MSAMKRNAWGDGLALIAVSECLRCKIFVISSLDHPDYPGKYIVSVTPSSESTGSENANKQSRTVLLSHTMDLYFDSLTQVVDTPIVDANMNDDQYNINFKDLRLIKKIATGSTAEIWECLWKGIRCAAKKIQKNMMDSETLSRFNAEIAMLKRFRFPNIILYMGMCVDDTNLYIITGKALFPYYLL